MYGYPFSGGRSIINGTFLAKKPGLPKHSTNSLFEIPSYIVVDSRLSHRSQIAKWQPTPAQPLPPPSSQTVAPKVSRPGRPVRRCMRRGLRPRGAPRCWPASCRRALSSRSGASSTGGCLSVHGTLLEMLVQTLPQPTAWSSVAARRTCRPRRSDTLSSSGCPPIRRTLPV